jgi:hypothetical protein
MEKRVSPTIEILDMHNFILDQEGPEDTKVRSIDRLHIDNIKILMRRNPQAFHLPFAVMVDPKMCPSVKEWDRQKKDEYRYIILGGNHLARAKVELCQAYHSHIFREAESWIYAGLEKSECQKIAVAHNVDMEYKKNMSNIDRIRMCHKIFVAGGEKKGVEVREQCAKQCGLAGYVKGERRTLQKYDPLFQLSFRSGRVWDLQDKIFRMWERFEMLNQKKENSPRKPMKTSKHQTLTKLAGELNLSVWRSLQGFLGNVVLEQVLGRVASRTISLEEMAKELETLKLLDKTKLLFVQLANQPDWKTCRQLFPDFANYDRFRPFLDKLKPCVSLSHL